VNIAKKALTNATVKAVSVLLGLRGLTRDDLKALGRGVGASIDYRTEKKARGSSPPKGSGSAGSFADPEPVSSSKPKPKQPRDDEPSPFADMDWGDLCAKWCAEARRINEQHGIEADRKYLSYAGGDKFVPYDDIKNKWPSRETKKRRAWLERVLGQMLDDYPAAADSGDLTADDIPF